MRRSLLRQPRAWYATAGRSQRGIGWHGLPAAEALPRQPQDVMIEDYAREP